jgi:[ribosomal protein S5]-alanine N-acetyltransferase
MEGKLKKQIKKELLNKSIMNMNINLFHSLEGTRLQLRTITMEDAAEMLAYLSDEEVSRFIGWRLMHTLEDTRGHIGTLLAREEAGTHLYAAVVLKATGVVIGNAMLFNMDDEAGHAEIGYVFDKGYWGQGYGTECVALVDNFAFGTLQLRKLYACVNAANLPSARILEKNGYMLEGVLSDGSLRYQKENGLIV